MASNIPRGQSPRSTGTGATKTPKSERTRKRILAAAREVMLRHGNTEFQMSEIAQICDISKGALYYYFSNREAIIGEIVSNDIDSLIAMLEEVAADAKDTQDVLLGFCMTFAQFVRDGSFILASISNQVANISNSMLPDVEERVDRILELVEEQVVRGKEEGTVAADVSPDFVAYSVLGTVFFAAYDRLKRVGSDFNVADFSADLMRFVSVGITAS